MHIERENHPCQVCFRVHCFSAHFTTTLPRSKRETEGSHFQRPASVSIFERRRAFYDHTQPHHPSFARNVRRTASESFQRPCTTTHAEHEKTPTLVSFCARCLSTDTQQTPMGGENDTRRIKMYVISTYLRYLLTFLNSCDHHVREGLNPPTPFSAFRHKRGGFKLLRVPTLFYAFRHNGEGSTPPYLYSMCFCTNGPHFST